MLHPGRVRARLDARACRRARRPGRARRGQGAGDRHADPDPGRLVRRSGDLRVGDSVFTDTGRAGRVKDVTEVMLGATVLRGGLLRRSVDRRRRGARVGDDHEDGDRRRTGRPSRTTASCASTRDGGAASTTTTSTSPPRASPGAALPDRSVRRSDDGSALALPRGEPTCRRPPASAVPYLLRARCAQRRSPPRRPDGRRRPQRDRGTMRVHDRRGAPRRTGARAGRQPRPACPIAREAAGAARRRRRTGRPTR